MGGTYNLHGDMKKEYINISIGKHERKRTLGELVAVRKIFKTV
jgi:hypothetical protein